MSIKSLFENIANAIKNVYGTTDTLTPAEMPEAITNFNSIFQTKNLSAPISGQTTVEGCLSSLSSDLSELIKYQSIDATIASIPANGKGNYRVDPTIPSGYEIRTISVVSLNSMDTDVVPYIHFDSSSNIYVYARNHSSGALSNQSFRVYLTYGKISN